jgi:hypothetical protein
MLPVTHGDEWPAAVVREVFSQSRTYFVRVVPGKSFGDTRGFSGAPKGPFASAEFYRLEKDRSYRLVATAPLLNPVAPAEFLVADNGFLMTLDNWHNMGYGKVVAFYTPEGKTIQAYTLSDLFSKSEIEAFDQSVSRHRQAPTRWSGWARSSRGRPYKCQISPGAEAADNDDYRGIQVPLTDRELDHSYGLRVIVYATRNETDSPRVKLGTSSYKTGCWFLSDSED